MLAQERTPLSVWKHRLLARLQAVLCRWRGQHVISGSDWGYASNGMVDCYCPNCLQIVARKPLEDFSGMQGVIDTVAEMRTRGREE